MVQNYSHRKSNLEAENPHDSQRNTKSRCIESIDKYIALMWRLRAIAAISWITAPVAGLIHAVIDELHHDQIVSRPWVRGIGSRRLKWNPSWSCRSCGWCPIPRFSVEAPEHEDSRHKGPAYVLRKASLLHLKARPKPSSNFQCHCLWLPSWFPSRTLFSFSGG